MASDDSLDRDSLSSKTVVELREICKDRLLMVSGKKSELVDRILGDIGVGTAEDQSETLGALILDDDPDESEPEVPDSSKTFESTISSLRGEVIDAEVMEAELVDSDPEPVTEAETSEIGDSREEDQASLVITIPTISSLGERWQSVAVVTVVIILVGALATQVLQRNAGFTTSPLHYGDQMDFFVSGSEISINGDEMLSLVRESTGGILDDACGQLSAEMSGTGSVSITDGYNSGAVWTTDNLGRDDFLSVEKKLSMDLDVDFEGRTWRDPGDCGNIGWSLSDNKLIIDSTSWVEIEDIELKRTDSTVSFRDIDSVTTNLRAVTYDMNGFGGLGGRVRK